MRGDAVPYSLGTIPPVQLQNKECELNLSFVDKGKNYQSRNNSRQLPMGSNIVVHPKPVDQWRC